MRFAVLATRDRDEALDLVQDAMLRLSQRYATRPAQEWPALFHRILTNRIRDWQRARRVRSRLFFWQRPLDDEGTDAVDLAVDPFAREGSGELEREQTLAVIDSALRRLPDRQREAFQLRVWEGLSVEDAAKAMGCSPGSVKTHLFRAMETLRAQLHHDTQGKTT